MDPELYAKLPSGCDLWEYKHEYASQFTQKEYSHRLLSKIITGESSVKEDSKKSIKRKETLIHYIICQIDPHACLYTYAMFEQAESIFRTRITDFISSGNPNKWLGPKKTRVLMAWITKNNHGVINEMGKIIADFLSWFLDKTFKFIPENTSPIMEENVIYFIYENRTFSLK